MRDLAALAFDGNSSRGLQIVNRPYDRRSSSTVCRRSRTTALPDRRNQRHGRAVVQALSRVMACGHEECPFEQSTDTFPMMPAGTFPPVQDAWFLTGPTASGKSRVGIELAKRL